MGVIYHPVPALPHLVCFAALYIYLKFHFFNSWIKFHCIEVTWYHHPFISCWMMSRDGLWIEHLWTWMNTCLCSRKGEPFDWITLCVSVGSYGRPVYHSLRNSGLLSSVCTNSHSQQCTMQECSLSPTSSPAFAVFSFLNLRHSNYSNTKSHSNLHLHSPDG